MKKEITTKLNELLSDYQMFYQNLRGFHWNIKGKHFFELHVKFEEMYNDSQQKIDIIAERILTLNEVPFHSFDLYIKNSKIQQKTNVFKDVEIVKSIIKSLKILLKKETEILNLSDELSDEATNSLMSDFISEQEKTLWMFKSWLD